MEESTVFRPSASRLMDQVRETLRFYHYAYNTEKSSNDNRSGRRVGSMLSASI